MTGVRAVIDPAFTIAPVDERLFGSFVEHMGRAVYGGISEPGHPTATPDGWRGDVLELVRELGVTVVRYPGGNFVSGYDWEDGIGPVEDRPTRLDLAWRSIEPNTVGTDEFMAWARLAGAEPMLAVNLGTRGADAARSLVEYCNAPAGSVWADRRVANGNPEPYGVRLWCLGNEMDGWWQIGHKNATEYGHLAAETGKLMKLVDPSIELVLAGSSGPGMATFGAWDDTALDLAWDVTDHLSVHRYYDRAEYPDTAAYLASSADFERLITTIAATIDAVGGRKKSRKQIGLCIDEWNAWHQVESAARAAAEAAAGAFQRAPALAEDDHDLADALVVGSLLITLLRHADRVRIACLAQLVNVIAPIRTIDGGPAWRQATFYPFLHASRYGRGTVLRVEPDGPTYPVAAEGDVPSVVMAAVHDGPAGALTVFAVNRAAEPVPLEAVLRDMDDVAVTEHLQLAGPSLSASNSAQTPDAVRPVEGKGASVEQGTLTLTLAARSWTVVRLTGDSLGGPFG